MGDRQDIDALLVGALYGELDSDDRARLDTHLASHPGDRAALDGLRSTRAMLRDAAIGDAEPPAAISARLLQEAARRAPAPQVGEGLLGWFASLFRPIASHPALSAAAAIVLVIGVGSLLMKRGEWKVANPEVASHDQTVRDRAAEPATMTATGGSSTGGAPSGGLPGSEAGSAFEVALADPSTVPPTEPLTEGLADGTAERKQGSRLAAATEQQRGLAKDEGALRPKAAPKPSVTSGYIELDNRTAGGELAMREPDVQDRGDDKGNAFRLSPPSGATGTRPTDDAAMREETERPPSTGQNAGPSSRAPNAPPSIAPAAPPADPDATGAALKKSAENNAWARDQHARMVKLVNAGKCTEAGTIGAEINRKAPEYYQSAVANDRAVRSCQAYVDRARRAKAPAPAKSKVGNQQPDSRNDADESVR